MIDHQSFYKYLPLNKFYSVTFQMSTFPHKTFSNQLSSMHEVDVGNRLLT